MPRRADWARGAGLTPLRALKAEAALRESALDDASLHAVSRVAAEECTPLDDVEASAWYRRQMVRVYVARAARQAASRANEALPAGG